MVVAALCAVAPAAGQDTPEDYRGFVVAAEDRRLSIPDTLHTPVLDELRLRIAEDIRILLKLTRSSNPDAQRLAIRALGRYERRELIADLLPLLTTTSVRQQAARAIVQAFRGPVHRADRDGEQVERVMHHVNTLAVKDDEFLPAAADAIAQLPYARADQAEAAQRLLRELLRRVEANASMPVVGVVGAIERFARTYRKLSPLEPDLVERLRYIAVASDARRRAASPYATAALVEAGAMDVQTLRSTAVDAQYADNRRLSAIVLAGTALQVDEPERIHFLAKLLQDPDVPVRVEAVRAWARRATPAEGCERLLGALADRSHHVSLTALDALAEACPNDVNVTDRLAADAKRPTERWHRAAHALVALARRAPDRAKIPLNAIYVAHPIWQLRMYAARAASILKDVTALERLATDPHDNVREAALAALREATGTGSDHIFVAALRRRDYQLLMTAANVLAGSSPTPELSGALLAALLQVTAERKDTSRETRLALIERLRELGTPDQAEHIAPLLRDFDLTVALAAAALYERWAGPAPELLAPVPLPRPPLPTSGELSDDLDAVVEMRTGAKFGLRFLADDAPLTVTRFKRLARAGYYNGLTFHRVVSNFVIQGGSPGANEYAGDAVYMRDEIGEPHDAFTVGVSTRGRDTGDAQFFINLVENRRLDPNYTVFAVVCDVGGGAGSFAERPGRRAVESIAEGDVINSITLEEYDPCRKGR